MMSESDLEQKATLSTAITVTQQEADIRRRSGPLATSVVRRVTYRTHHFIWHGQPERTMNGAGNPGEARGFVCQRNCRSTNPHNQTK